MSNRYSCVSSDEHVSFVPGTWYPSSMKRSFFCLVNGFILYSVLDIEESYDKTYNIYKLPTIHDVAAAPGRPHSCAALFIHLFFRAMCIHIIFQMLVGVASVAAKHFLVGDEAM